MIDISTLEISILELKKNLELIKSKLNKDQKVCFVAKANSYGFGDKICGFFDNYVDYFAVSSDYEFYRLRKIVKKPILILDTIYDEKILRKLILKDAELTVSNKKSLEQLLKIDKCISKEIKVHIAINTGMNRFGISSILEFYNIVKEIENSQNIKIYGIFSHFFNGKCEKSSQKRLKKFIKFNNLLKKIINYNYITHICATDGTLYNNFGDMVRLGFGIYDNNINETITLKTKILDIQSLDYGETAGYEGVFVAKKKTEIAVIGIGYGDGIPRSIVKKGYVLVNDQYAKIVASCMDCMIIDVTNIKHSLNDDVVIIGKYEKNKISICDIAKWCDTIGYEIIVRLSSRIKRVCIGESKCKLSQENIVQEN